VSDAYIKKPNGDRYNLGHDKVVDIINSESYKKIRKDMIDGVPVAGCERCYLMEKNEGFSDRQDHNKAWKDDTDFKQKYQQSLNNEDLTNTVQYYDLRFGNLCNLACRSCYGGASSQFAKEIKIIKETQPEILKFHGETVVDNSWYTTDIFNENVIGQLPSLKWYYCVGGEPTIIDKNYDILQSMVESGESKHIVLSINSNLTNTKKDFYSFFKHFKYVIIYASIDGTHSMFEYLRYPGNWEAVSNNLLKIVNMELPNLSIEVTPVVQKTNLSHMPELFEYIESINRKYKKSIILIRPLKLVNPSYLDLKYLPLEYKIKCWENINNWIVTSHRYQPLRFYWSIKNIKNACFEETNYQDNLKDYFKFNDIFDRHRNQSLAEINPELNSLRV